MIIQVGIAGIEDRLGKNDIVQNNIIENPAASGGDVAVGKVQSGGIGLGQWPGGTVPWTGGLIVDTAGLPALKELLSRNLITAEDAEAFIPVICALAEPVNSKPQMMANIATTRGRWLVFMFLLVKDSEW